MRFSITAILAFAAATLPVVLASPAASVAELRERQDDFTALALAPADLQATDALVSDAEADAASVQSFNGFTSQQQNALVTLFSQINSIPDDVLNKGDDATNAWIKNNIHPPAPSVAEANALALGGGDAWRIAHCITAIVQAIAGFVFPFTKLLRIKKLVKALGGVKKAAQLLVKAKSKADLFKIGGKALVALASEISGVASIRQYCFKN